MILTQQDILFQETNVALFHPNQEEQIRYWNEAYEETDRVSRTIENIFKKELEKKNAIIAEKDRIIIEKDRIIAEKDRIIAEKDRIIAEKESAIASITNEFEQLLAEIAQLKTELLQK